MPAIVPAAAVLIASGMFQQVALLWCGLQVMGLIALLFSE